jgi:hypothetical protein
MTHTFENKVLGVLELGEAVEMVEAIIARM